MAENTLYYGDNLNVLRRHIQDETVDLIYLDPPFNSKATYNVLFGEKNGSQATAQIKAFDDTWTWDQSSAQSYQEVVEGGGKVSQAMQAFRTLLGDNDMLAYLSMMAPRLMELRRVLKPTGSIYLHCDPTASHYLKMLMDAVFEARNFRNEIVWERGTASGGKAGGNKHVPNHDIILFYSKDVKNSFFRRQYIPYTEAYIEQRFKYTDESGRRYRLQLGNRRQYLDESKGKPTSDIWVDIFPINPMAKEKLGYPTQKPEALLERILQASSNKGDLVLDPFCGCGTAVAVALRLNRRWIGIDITQAAIRTIKERLKDTFGSDLVYQVIGEPVSIPDAQTLADQDPYQFQWWALGLVGARPVEQKKGSDKGIDGRLYFHDEGGKTKQIILSVKAGHTSVDHIRDLRGVVEREQAEIGVLLTMQEPTRPMRTEVAGAGFYHSPGWDQNYPKLQILTVAELLAGKGIEMPPIRQVNKTFKKAPRVKKPEPQSRELPGI